jgi:signal transduction histidine kinase/ligand-binding sensor domain-containing protein
MMGGTKEAANGTPLIGRAILAACLLGLGSNPGQGQTADAQNDPERVARQPFHVYDERDGSVCLPFECMILDAKGYLWCGTQDGILRYDGRTWTRIPAPEPNRSVWFCSALASRDGSLWFGTNGNGVHRFKDGVWTSFTTRTGFPALWVAALAETLDAQGRPVVWAGSAKEGLWKAEGDHFVPVPCPAKGGITSLLPTQDGGLWAGTQTGLYRYANGAWTALPGPGRLPVLCLAMSSEGNEPVLWVGTNRGLAALRGGQWRQYSLKEGLPSWVVTALAVERDADGTSVIWASTDRGMGVLRRGSFTNMGTHNGLPSDIVRSLLVSQRPGTPTLVWIGTFAGLAQYSPGKWHSFTASSGLKEPVVFSIREAKDHSFWFGSAGAGLLHLNRGKWSSVEKVDGAPLSVVFTLSPGRDVQYAGCRDEGVLVRSGDQWHHWNQNHLLPMPSVYALLETRDAAGATILWAGTRGGLLRTGPEGAQVFGKGTGLDPHHDTARLSPRAAPGAPSLWVGTRGGGVSRYRQGKWDTFGEPQGLQEGRIASLTAIRDPEGRTAIWVGTLSGGPARFDPDHPERPWLFLSENDMARLPSRNVESVQSDAQGRIYLFTLGGIVRLTPRKDGSFGFRSFKLGDGLPSNTCTMGSSMVDSAGRIWTGTAAGVAFHDPSREPEDTVPKPLYFDTCLELGNRALLRDGAQLTHRQNRLRFEFSLLSFYRESDTRYRVQLEGLDPVPGPWTAEARQEYAAVPDGRYTFKVWAQDHAGNLSGPISLAFRVRPAPWRHPIAYAIYAALVLGAAWGFMRLRIALLHARNEALQARVQEATAALTEREAKVVSQAEALTAANLELRIINEQKSRFLGIAAHDLRNPLSGIILTAEQLLEEDDESRKPRELRRIIEQARSMTELIGRFLDVTALETGSIQVHLEPMDLVEFVRVHAQAFQAHAEAKAIRLELLLPEAGPLLVRSDLKLLAQILDNLLSNALKFSPRDRTVRVRVEDAGRTGRLRIEDQGPGLSKEDLSRVFGWFAKLSATPTAGESSLGLGLSIVKNMVDATGGSIRVESAPGEGATFIVDLPKP